MTVLSAYGFPQRHMLEWMCSNGRGYTIQVTPSVWMRGGMFEVVDVFPSGSGEEPDLSINPVLEEGKEWTTR